jgi:hypothetical protein
MLITTLTSLGAVTLQPCALAAGVYQANDYEKECRITTWVYLACMENRFAFTEMRIQPRGGVVPKKWAGWQITSTS